MSRRPVRRRTVWIAGLLLTLVVAGFVSSYASASPDGLEWAASESGFADTARDSAVTGSPLADYGVTGVDDERVSGGLAGVIGVGATLALAGGLTLALRRRTSPGARD